MVQGDGHTPDFYRVYILILAILVTNVIIMY